MEISINLLSLMASLRRSVLGKRDQEREPVPNHYHWRQIFEVVQGQVILHNQLSQMDEQRNVPLRDVVTQVVDNMIILGKKRNQLNLVLLQPKQRARPGEHDATVGKVSTHYTVHSTQYTVHSKQCVVMRSNMTN